MVFRMCMKLFEKQNLLDVHLCADMIIWGILLSIVLCAVMGNVWGCCWVHISLEIVYKILTKWSKIWITNTSSSFRKDVLHSLLSSLLPRMKCVSLEFTCIDTCCHLLWGLLHGSLSAGVRCPFSALHQDMHSGNFEENVLIGLEW